MGKLAITSGKPVAIFKMLENIQERRRLEPAPASHKE
jgi:hypothetical protein